MKINLVLLALMVLTPFLAKSQKEDSLKTKIYIDNAFGYFRTQSFVGLLNTQNPKIIIGEKVETSFDLKNPHFGIGGKYFLYRKIDELDFVVKKKFDVGLATLSYSPFLEKNLVLIAGIGGTSKKETASYYSVRYLIDSLYPEGSLGFETSLTTMGEDLDYEALLFVTKRNYFIGGYYANNGISGLCFGAYEQYMFFKFVLSKEKIEGQNLLSGTFQLDLTFPFIRKDPKFIYR